MDRTVLEKIYEQIKTPYKYGAVLKLEGRKTDSPIVFKRNEKYYMSFVSIDNDSKTGYSTHIAESNDLLHWNVLGEILKGHTDWDSAQSGGYAQLQDNYFGGSNELLTIDGKYLFAYIGGNLPGYETDPLSMGIATADDFLNFDGYQKYSKPVLSGSDRDAREGETLTIYKADIFYDSKKTLGYPYVNAYNAKDSTNRESIFLAVSDDGIHWKRYGARAVIPVTECADSVRINGDPQIIMVDGYYVMLYFIYDKTGAYNTFAVSSDLINWTKWDGAPLVKSEYDWENIFAHKQWVIKENGIVYHYYCAVNEKERFIALATSKPMK
ncbi:MAG: glycosylase [Clostridia bacterium]|nr:glycosylase [Clostridia bacterium]